MPDRSPKRDWVAETYCDIARWVEASLDMPILTPEYEIVSVLFDAVKMTPLELLGHFSGSNTLFYKLLGDLEVRGALTSEPNPTDRRSKLYRLSDLAEDHLSRQWQSYRLLGREEAYKVDDLNQVISRYTRTVRTGLKVKQFTAEFQILLHIHSTPGISNIQFSSLVNVSKSKFNESLRWLKQRGDVIFDTDLADRRRKAYYLPADRTEIFEELDERMFAWLDSKFARFEKPPA